MLKEVSSMKEKKSKKEIIDGAKEKSLGLISEFKVFSRGNVVDLAVGVIIGSAFGKIVTSLVNDILMPVIGTIFGGLNFNNLVLKINNAEIRYGSFIQNVVDFLIIAACIFMFVKIINKFMKKKEDEEEVIEEVKKSDEVLLLEEIRDLLKAKNSKK